MANPKPYGPRYQDMIEAVAIEHGCGIPAMACLHFICRKIDWETGVMPHQMALATIGQRIGGSYRTAYRAMRQLREAGVIDYASRGNNYDGGDANIYRFKIPALAPTGTPSTPLPDRQAPPCHKGRHPPATKAELNPHPSLSRGEKAPAGRGAGPADASGVCPDSGQSDGLSAVRPWDGIEPYGNYLGRVKAAEREALRAAENG